MTPTNITTMSTGKLFTTAGGAGAVGGGIAAAIITGIFGFLPNITNVDPKVTEVAIAVLQTEPEAAPPPLRNWAMNVIDKRATIPFNAEQREALLKTKLPKLQTTPPPPPPQGRPGG
jgi:hypothetical protein